MPKRKSSEKAQEAGPGAGKAMIRDAEKAGIVRAPTPVETAVRSMPPKVPQKHGGALYAGGVPGNRGGGLERRERIEAIKEALTGHVERLSGPRPIAATAHLLEPARQQPTRRPTPARR